MNSFKPFIINRYLQAKNQFSLLALESRLKIAFISTFVAAYFLLGTLFVYRALEFIQAFPIFGSLIIERSFYLYFFILSIMLAFSAFLLTLSLLFNSAETAHLMTLPVTVLKIFIIKFAEVAYVASWAFVFISIPLYLAYGAVSHVRVFTYLSAGVVILLPFVIISCSLGYVLAIISIRFLFNLKGLIIAASGLGFIIFRFFVLWQKSHDIVTNDVVRIFNRLMEHTELTLYPVFPSVWITKLFFSIGEGSSESLLYFNLVFSGALFSFCCAILTAKLFGYSAWSHYHSMGSSKIKFSVFYLLEYFCKFFIPQNRAALVAKDIQLFLRDPVQFAQFGIFFGLLLFYIFNLKNMRYDLSSLFWKNLITFLNFGSVTLVLSTLSTRFFFPQISMEGRSIWILGMSSISKAQIVYTKFIYTGLFCTLITLPLSLISNHMLNIAGFFNLYTVALALIAALAISAISIGMGALFPNFNASSSAEVVSGFGGTLTLIISLAYVSVITLIPALIGHLEVVNTVSHDGVLQLYFFSLILILVLSCILASYILKRGISNLQNMEI